MRSRISSALIAVGSLGGLLVAAVVIYGYTTSPGWVGVANKTLWDWLELVIVPIVIAVAVFLLSNAAERERQLEQRERELFQQSERAQDSALQAFLDQLSHSDTYRELRTAPASGHKRAVQRAKMQTLLMQLNGPRKGVLLSFLHGAKLTRKKEMTPYEYTKEGSEEEGEERWNYPILRLDDIDFSQTELNPDTKLTFDDLRSINLRAAKLSKVNLSGANLKNADLRDAVLSGAALRKPNEHDAEEIPGEFHSEVEKPRDKAGKLPPRLMETDLSGADLREADLIETDLRGADLSFADLRRANLSIADLNEADLRGAILSGADGITNEELAQQAKSLEGAYMPNGQKYEDWLKSKGSGEDGENSGPS